jgi:hypothetical protein
MFNVRHINIADIVMMETDIPSDLHKDLCTMLSYMKETSRILSYLDLRKMWASSVPFSFRQLDTNRPVSDRFPTSWSVQRGHHFYIWTKVPILLLVPVSVVFRLSSAAFFQSKVPPLLIHSFIHSFIHSVLPLLQILICQLVFGNSSRPF